ncbi:uncharacterized protein LOC130047427 [Ostrea edulis]|uniref:uncharacterized protein LOC130047427 n=1 Tax=Ostrea edulis TaxID=37623 RepID=UPI0024AEE10D|nr:uncharacterized protein LOC130047427 [Ostrea edulis]XP_055998402.1 uncharacterized protein LOC130047427 [Ostrea edulis]XP_055998403.1 uncharacterized protein LOC130047427 [Ostrea edulis]XP_055998404.1 uncharacterized protein LOC130047427 [Ostrea edulis]XP_055998405.1 uncharacterized protein LOC130047427 [Ostrea edulis]
MLRVKRRARNAPYIGPVAGTRGAAARKTRAHASARPTTVTTHMATDLPTQPSLPVIPLSTPAVVDPHQQVMANFPINENRGEQTSGENVTNTMHSYHEPAIAPLVSVGDELAVHIEQTIKEKIWNRDYIELSKLIQSEFEISNEQRVSVVNGQLVIQPKNPPKRITAIHTWTDAFLIFASIYLTRNPVDLQGILKYMHIVRLAANRSVSGWIEYDRQIRLRLSRILTFPGVPLMLSNVYF